MYYEFMFVIFPHAIAVALCYRTYVRIYQINKQILFCVLIVWFAHDTIQIWSTNLKLNLLSL